MTNDEMIAVIQADKNGEVVECAIKLGTPVWKEVTDIRWNFPIYNYRVKPKPLEQWVNIYSSYRATYLTKKAAKAAAGSGVERAAVHMREVI